MMQPLLPDAGAVAAEAIFILVHGRTQNSDAIRRADPVNVRLRRTYRRRRRKL